MNTSNFEYQKKHTRQMLIIGLSVFAAFVLTIFFFFMISPRSLINAQAKNYSEPTAAPITLNKSHTGDFIEGLNGEYNISVSISGITGTITDPLTIIVTDTLPSQFASFSHSSPGWVITNSGNTITWTYPITWVITDSLVLPPIKITVPVPVITPIVVTNTAYAAIYKGGALLPDVSPVSDNDPTHIIKSTDLQVSKSVFPTSPLEGELITYTLVVMNNGPINATNVNLTDTLPSDITYLPSSSIIPPGQSYNPSTGLWTIGTLGNGASTTLKLVCRVNLKTNRNTIVNTTRGLTSDLPDYNPSNNTASVSFTVTGAPDLQIFKTDYQTSIYANDKFTYTIYITNAGSTSADGIVITDILPNSLSYVTDTFATSISLGYITTTPNTYYWEYPKIIDAGKNISFSLGVKAAGTLPGPQTNTVKVSTTTSEGNTSNNTATDTDSVIYAPSISFSKSVSPSEAAAGSNFTFYIYVTNNSTASVTDVTVKDTFPSSLTVNSVSPSRGTYSYNNNTRALTVKIGTLPSYNSATITISCKVNSSSTSTTYLTNYAYLSYDFSDDSFDKTASVSYRITGGSSLPSTGGVEPGIIGPPSAFSAGVWIAIACCILLFIAGIVLMVYWRKLSLKQSEWAGWCLRMGSVMIGVSICFGAAAWGLSNITKSPTPQVPEPIVETTPMISSIKPVYIPPADDELEFLPEYPVPTPSFVPSPESTEQVVDDSPPNRLMIPDLGVDTVIKYVPYDGFTWLISGLKQEVAWLGDTSWPGLGGNTGLAGHVTLFNGENGPFRFLDQLGVGSPITVFTEKNIYTYKVRQSLIVDASQMEVLEPSTQPSLTLITCTNWDTAAGYYLNRYIVYADLDTTVPIGGNLSGN